MILKTDNHLYYHNNTNWAIALKDLVFLNNPQSLLRYFILKLQINYHSQANCNNYIMVKII